MSMKRNYFLLLSSLLLQHFLVKAQNVGIGTTNPQQKLHVAGDIRVDGMANPGNGMIITNEQGDLLRMNFTGNADDVLKGNGSFGPALSGGLPAGTIVGSADPNSQPLKSNGYSFFGEMPTMFTSYLPFPSQTSEPYLTAPTYEAGDTAKIAAPASRGGHSASWTGSQLFIWGGYQIGADVGIHFLNDGAMYNPSTDSWTPLPALNAPTKRVYASSVWTGTEIIVWGGLDSINLANGFAVFNNNGRKYNPATNTWTTTSLALAPAARMNAASAWTGANMVIWGGSNGSALSNGARYNPATNSWSSISTLNAPLADGNKDRVFWTGSTLIVLGYQDTVARYNPNTNVWSISARCPAGDYYNKSAAVWTGNELWVYHNQKLYKYNPSTNIWTTLNIGGITWPGSITHAVWTDSEMWLFVNEYDSEGRFAGNRYYIYRPSENSFYYSHINYEAVQSDMSVNKAGGMVIRWGGFAHLENQDGGSYRFSRRGVRIYLISGLNIPAGYAPSGHNNKLYLYRKD